VEKALKEVGDKVEASQKSGVEADLAALKDLLGKAPADGTLTDAQVADIKAAKEKLMNSSQALFTKMYENMQQNAGAQAGPNPGAGAAGTAGTAGNDDVVDADYKEV
jgi:molecular chaperone DnaK